MTDEEALRNARADGDNSPLTDEQLARMRRVPDPQAIRQRMGLTRRKSAGKFEIALGTLRDWEQGARGPDSAAKANPRVAEQNPEAVLAALGLSRGSSVLARQNRVPDMTRTLRHGFDLAFPEPPVADMVRFGIETPSWSACAGTRAAFAMLGAD